MEFSIVITTYNRLSLLQRAIESALIQTLPCEIMVIDDNSRDGTPDYLKKLGEKIRYHRNAANYGHSTSVNQGVKLARGTWIKLLDDDDYLAPTCIEVMLQEITQHQRAVICSCQAVQVTLNGVEIKRTRLLSSQNSTYIPQEDIHYQMLLEYLPLGTPVQVSFRRDAFLRAGGWNPQFDLDYDDIDAWVRIAQFGDAISINQPLVYRTLWEGGYNQYFSIPDRLAANIAIKKRIYALVNEKYQNSLPPMSDIENYLKLHWGFVALKNRQIITFCQIAFSALFLIRAWSLFLKANWR